MALFEAAWREGFEYFERVHDEVLGRSVKRMIDLPFEWYEPHTKGLYQSIQDPTLRFEKKQGRSKDGRGHFGFTDPIYRNIRENYWLKSYNKAPRIWYLDIETRSGRSYKNLGMGDLKIRNIKTQKEHTMPVKEIQDLFFDLGENSFEFYDVKAQAFRPLRNNFYMQRNKGFPVPNKARESVSVIQIFDSELNEVIMIGLREWKHKEAYEHLMEYPVKYIVAKDEMDLFTIYNKLFAGLNPLFIYAWNGDGFDFPYLHNRMKNLGIDPNLMSNYGEVKYTEREWQGRLEYKIETPGHYYLDLMVVYKHFIKKPRSSYTLDNIAEVELGENKVEHSEYSQFDHFYLGLYNIPENPTEEQKNSEIYKLAIKDGVTEEVRELGHSEFCWYSYKDPLLIKKIDDKLNFTSLILTSSEKMGVLIPDSFRTVRPWSQYISNVAQSTNQVVPPVGDNPDPNIVGGYCRDPSRGKKKWVMAADVNSMYPLLGMVGFNMSPETFREVSQVPEELRDIVLSYFNDQDEGSRLDYPIEVWDNVSRLLKENKLSMGINGAIFSCEQEGIIPRLILEIYNERKATRVVESQYIDRKMLIEEILHEKRSQV